MAGDGRSAKLLPVPNAPSTRPLRILVVGAGAGGISIARGLLRDGHDVTVFEQRSAPQAGGGAVTIWSNGATVLGQLGVDMDGAGQPLSTVRVTTPRGRSVATMDLKAIVDRLGEPVRMGPRRVLLERLLEGFPADRIRCNTRAVGLANTHSGVRLEFEDGSSAEGDVLIGADGLHSMVRGVVGAPPAQPTGWGGWRGRVPPPAGRGVWCAVVVRSSVVVGFRQTRPSDRDDPVRILGMVRTGGPSSFDLDR